MPLKIAFHMIIMQAAASICVLLRVWLDDHRCYTCSWRVGWTETAVAKANCDKLMWDNQYRACDYWYPSDPINRSGFKATADTMYAVLSVASASWLVTQTCPGDSWKLANTNFCFDPQYSLESAYNKIKPGNGQQWGSWSNYAQVGPGICVLEVAAGQSAGGGGSEGCCATSQCCSIWRMGI
jgi:hypothetical protein